MIPAPDAGYVRRMNTVTGKEPEQAEPAQKQDPEGALLKLSEGLTLAHRARLAAEAARTDAPGM